MRAFKNIFVLRLINQQSQLAKIYLERVQVAEYRDECLLEIYNEFIVPSPVLSEMYRYIVDSEEPEYVITDTQITRSIAMLCKMYGWKDFIEGLATHAKNEESYCKQMGLEKPAARWKKISGIVSALPKNIL